MGRKHVRDGVEGKKVVVIDVEVSKKVLGRFKERLRQNGLRFYIKVTSLKRLLMCGGVSFINNNVFNLHCV